MMRAPLALLLLALALLAGTVQTAVAQQAQPADISVRGGLHEGYARLVFDWPGSMEVQSRVEGNTLIVTFDRPIRANLDSAVADLRSFLAGGSMTPDGRSAIFALVPGAYEARNFKIGTSVVVDLVRQGAAAAPPAAAPQAAAPIPAAPAASVPPADAPRLTVRGGDHAGYSRLVFDWNRPVEFSVDRGDGTATVRFDRPAQYEIGSLNSRPLRNIRRVDPVAASEGRAVDLRVPGDARLRYFRSGTKVVVDVLDPAEAAPAPTADAAPRPTPPRPTPPRPAPPQSAQTSAPADAPASSPAAPTADAPAQQAAPAVPPVASGEGGGQAITSAVPATPATPTTLGPSQPQRIRAPVALEQLPGEAVPVTLRREGDMVALRFEWQQAVSAAVFRRAGHLWVAFDEGRRFALTGDITGLETQVFSQAQQVPVPVGSLLRARLVEGVNPRVWRDGNAWVVELRAQGIRPDVPLNAEVQPVSPQGPRLFIPVTGIGETIIVRDPEVGDELNIVPLAPLGRGIEGERSFAEFELLPTVQGIVVAPRADGVAIRDLPDGVAITSAESGGLALSRDVPKREATFGDQSESGLQSGRPFPMTQWRRGGRDSFYRDRQQLQFAIADATSIARTKPRMELAEYYFANGLAVEAQGLLRTIVTEDPDIANVPSFKALRGASFFASGRYAEAKESLSDRALDGSREIALWRGAAEAAMGNWNAAVEQFARAGEIPADYPRNYTTEIALLAAQAAIRVGDYRGAGEFLNVVADGQPTDSERARINFLRGRVLASAGDKDEAMALWRPLADGTDRWARIRAARAIIEEELAQGSITPGEAVQRLENLRFAWRGDELEFDLLRRMGELYLSQNDYRNGLATMREAVTLFPDSPETATLTQTMTDSFAKLYIDGIADQMPPLTALALYDDFRELTPPGARGNEMIRRLADRLVAVDLLDRAANLLDRQVKFRLEGVDKARIGARLALIRLLDRRPDAAIGALDESAVPGMPGELVAERGRLRARALFDLGQPDPALALLQSDTSREADLLRADILWRKQDWGAAAGVFARLAQPIQGKRDLTETEATTVLNWAISASMSENGQQVALIRQNYAQSMDNTPYREAFRLITNTTSGDLADLQTLTQRFQEVQRFQSFLSNYREKLKNSQLSAIN
ncbi:tetratricopeptide repeat protein [Oceanibaculum pacificum]|nr:tetratricopeptide repeat protein [Oceanibaculum pacificum]